MGDSIIRPKLVLLGESAVGKSSIVMRFVKSSFREHQEATIGAAFTTQTIWVGEPKRAVKFEIWDTAGQERYHSLTPMYYRGAAAAIVVYDITNTQSFSKAQTWVKELHEKADKMRVIALVGNKTDLESRRTVVTETSEAYAAQEGLLFYETSAKVGTNIGEVFEDIALHLPLDAASATPSGQNLDGDAANAGSRSCCR